MTVDSPVIYRNPTKTNWESFNHLVTERLTNISVSHLSSRADIDRGVNEITTALVESFEASCPIRRTEHNSAPPWLTRELKVQRKTVRRLYNLAKRSNGENEWTAYHYALRQYKYMIRRSKRKSWQLFCANVDGVNEMSRLKRFLSKAPSQPELLLNRNGERATSFKESLNILLCEHFPDCPDEALSASPAQNNHFDIVSGEGGDVFITNDMVKFAIDSFKPFKSPGRDGIFPALLQYSGDLLINKLASIYKACLKEGYTPKLWQEVKVVFIPKAGRVNYSTAKAYRPISLTSFLLKTLERMCEWEMRGSIPRSSLSQHQHAYVKGKSVETALHEVVHSIERGFLFKQSTLAVFIDVEGAFNNVLLHKFTEVLTKYGVNQALKRWITHMLYNRTVFTELGGVCREKRIHRGTPQGGILSPLLWVLIMDDLLQTLTRWGYKVVCYADDLAILVTGSFETELCGLVQNGIRLVTKWATDSGLRINPLKTDLCLFTKKRNIPIMNLPSIGPTRLELKDRVKYLGIILDKKLSWKPHLEDRACKAFRAFAMCRRAIGKKWGLKPRMILWIYTSVIRPILTYGAAVWWKAMEFANHRKILDKVQRLCLLSISGALKSSSTRALEVILNIHPVQIHIKKEASIAALRLHLNRGWTHTGTQVPHESILDFVKSIVPDINRDSDYLLETRLGANFKARIPSRAEWESQSVLQPLTYPIFYTDGSKSEDNTGAGIFCADPKVEIKIRLESHVTVFQAEIKAILEAGRYLLNSGVENKEIAICSDSQAAIKALTKPVVISKLVFECKTTLNSLSRCNDVLVLWVPGHNDISGNEKADELARLGAISEAIPSLIGISPGHLKSNIVTWADRQHNRIWLDDPTARTTKELWGKLNPISSRKLLRLNKPSLKPLVSILTGHSTLRGHLHKMGLIDNSECRGCGEEIETVTHFLCHCPALSGKRYRFLGSHLLDELHEAGKEGWEPILRFIKASGWNL